MYLYALTIVIILVLIYYWYRNYYWQSQFASGMRPMMFRKKQQMCNIANCHCPDEHMTMKRVTDDHLSKMAAGQI